MPNLKSVIDTKPQLKDTIMGGFVTENPAVTYDSATTTYDSSTTVYDEVVYEGFTPKQKLVLEEQPKFQVILEL